MTVHRKLVVAVVAVTVIAAGCGSAKSSSAGTAAAGAKGTISVGLLVDATGPGASGNGSSELGVRAGQAWALKQGYKVNVDIGDTQTSPAGALAAAQRMVERDHVQVVLAISALTFAAAGYLTSHGVPVIGAAEDSTEWLTSKNMFSVIGLANSHLVPSSFGQLMKMEGGSNLASVGYSISPGSSEAAKSAAVSAEAAGLKAGYVDASLPFGSTNVEPVVLAMKSAAVDSFTAATDPNTAFAFITSLRQQGIDLKFALLDDGYGGDLLQAGPGAAQAAQDVYFELGAEPVEMHTSATEQFTGYLKQAGVTGDPTFAEYNGYESVLLLVQALQAAGKDPTDAALLTALSGIHHFSAGGLYGSQTLDLSNRTGHGSGILNCVFITKFAGSTFHLVPHADPICGSIIPNRSVNASS